MLFVWQVAVMLTGTPAWLLPAPTTIALRMIEASRDGVLARHVWATVGESSGGFVLALLVATPVGYLLAQSRRLERWLTPYLTAIQSVPIIAIAPLLIIWWDGSVILRNIVIAAVVVFFPIFSATMSGIRTIPKPLREVALVEGATLAQRIRYVELPLALPVLFSGFRTSLAYATTGAVVAEFINARYGLGYLINIARGQFDTPLIFVAIFCLIAITLCFYGILRACEWLFLGWYEGY